MNLGPLTLNNQYFLHVRWDGAEIAAEIKREGLLVTIVNVGADFVDETTKVYTVKREDRGILFFDIVEPHGRGWERDEAADYHTDHWSAWRRRRTWKVA
jgi:hypothetical protein